MDNTDFRERVFLSLVKAIKNLIKKVEELISTIRSNNPRDYLAREWIDSTQVCHLLNISRSTLQKYVQQEVLPYSKINGKNFFRPRDIESILKENYTNKETLKTKKQ